MTDDRRTDLMELRQILDWRWDPLGVSDSIPLTGGEAVAWWFHCRRGAGDQARRPAFARH